MTAPIFLNCQNVGKTFPGRGNLRDVVALRDVSFTLGLGQVVALLGPSGCGKSTLLRMIAGLVAPTAGTITVAGSRVVGPGRDRGLVFQSYTAFDWLTLQDNVAFGLRLNGLGRDAARARALEFLAMVQLNRDPASYPAALSGGMKQRLALARTFANAPDIILLDEPFGALDSETRWVMQELLLSIVRQTGATVLMVTHDLDEALFLADRIVFLAANPGRVLEIIDVPFKASGQTTRKEGLAELPEYRAMQRHLTQAMRHAAANDTAGDSK